MLDKQLIQLLISEAMDRGAGFAEIFFEDRHSRSIGLEDGMVDQITSGVQRGVGIRIKKNDSTIFGFSENLEEVALLNVVQTLMQAISLQPKGESITIDFTQKFASNPSPIENDPRDVDLGRKVELLNRMDKKCRSVDTLISQVTAVYFESYHNIQIANSSGLYVEDERCRIRLRCQAIATRSDKSRQGFGSWGPGIMGGYEQLRKNLIPEEIAIEAAEQALTLLEAEPAPSGQLPLVVTNGVGGVLVHEACGHGLEGDVTSRSGSVYADKMGKKVAPSIVTVIDDGSIPNQWGSGTFDDEGNMCKKNVLINEGYLTSYMHDAETGRSSGQSLTGNGRRASFRHLPMPRMTNTYIESGEHTPEQIIGGTDFGIFARSFGGGVADMATGMFSFNVREGYIIRKGRITNPVTGITVVGNGPSVLQKIDMVGNDLELAPVLCGKDGQKAMVTVGQPTIRISEVTIGSIGNTGRRG